VKQKIVKIILCGRESGLQGLPDYLEATLGLSVELANVWCNVFSFDSYIPQIPRKESLAYASVIGLSLGKK
jgi:Tfp pilus assembly PilM family ATPase